MILIIYYNNYNLNIILINVFLDYCKLPDSANALTRCEQYRSSLRIIFVICLFDGVFCQYYD